MTAAAGDRIALAGGVALLERAMGYTLGSLLLVTPGDYGRPSPCDAWSLRRLLLHMNDSLAALHEAMTAGRIDVGPGGFADPRGDYGDPERDPVASLRDRGCQMIGSWVNAPQEQRIEIGDRSLTPEVIAATGAVEVAVHGWDVARACRREHPIPAALARDLLPFCPLLVRDGDRPGYFGPVVASPPGAGPETLLLTFLGRRPGLPVRPR